MHHIVKVSKGAKIRNQYNQVPLLTEDTNGKVTNSQLYTTNESQDNVWLELSKNFTQRYDIFIYKNEIWCGILTCLHYYTEQSCC